MEGGVEPTRGQQLGMGALLDDPAVVEENLPALLASEDEDAPLPEGIDPSQVNFGGKPSLPEYNGGR